MAAEQLNIDQTRLAEACGELGIRMVVLFGSHATGSPPPGPESDVDLAVAMERRDVPGRFWEAHELLSGAFPGASLDLAFLGDVDPLFRWEVVREGVLLWGDVYDFLEYRAFAFRDFVDSADLRALERTLFEKKMAYLREQVRGAA